MAFDFSALFWIFLAIMVLQPLFTGRWYALRRAQAIRTIERLHGSRVITMIHRQEKRSIFGFAVASRRNCEFDQMREVLLFVRPTISRLRRVISPNPPPLRASPPHKPDSSS
jgi:hypothetical protein